jgi:hypothetical protein
LNQTVGSSGVVHSIRCFVWAEILTQSLGLMSMTSSSSCSLAAPLSSSSRAAQPFRLPRIVPETGRGNLAGDRYYALDEDRIG